jgi:hypothetical protein
MLVLIPKSLVSATAALLQPRMETRYNPQEKGGTGGQDLYNRIQGGECFSLIILPQLTVKLGNSCAHMQQPAHQEGYDESHT